MTVEIRLTIHFWALHIMSTLLCSMFTHSTSLSICYSCIFLLVHRYLFWTMTARVQLELYSNRSWIIFNCALVCKCMYAFHHLFVWKWIRRGRILIHLTVLGYLFLEFENIGLCLLSSFFHWIAILSTFKEWIVRYWKLGLCNISPINVEWKTFFLFHFVFFFKHYQK